MANEIGPWAEDNIEILPVDKATEMVCPDCRLVRNRFLEDCPNCYVGRSKFDTINVGDTVIIGWRQYKVLEVKDNIIRVRVRGGGSTWWNAAQAVRVA